MSAEQKAPDAVPSARDAEPPLKRRAVTLYGIIIFKLVKGLLCVALAVVIYHEAKKDMSQDFQNFLQSPFVTTVLGELRINPENKFFTGLAESIDKLTEANVHRAAWGTVLLSLFPLVEGIGLLFRAPWAGWLAIGESAFFLPIEFYELVRPDHFSWSIFVIMIFNIIIVWYLYAYREVLFHHHHRHPRSAPQN
jgi:uncharacterized membrane protein (DUF2068 family)